MTYQEIIQSFQNYIYLNSGIYREWYIGVTADPDQRLFTDHNVDKQNDKWTHAPAENNEVARSVEKYFLDLGCDGGTGGGDYTSKTAYAYKKNTHTKP